MNKRFVSKVLGIGVLVLAIHSAFTGSTFGIGTLPQETRYVFYKESPIEFVVSVLLQFVLAYFLLRKIKE